MSHRMIFSHFFKEFILQTKFTEILFHFQQYVGSVELLGTKEEAIQEILSHQLVRYRVRFPLQNPLPKLTQIAVNGQVLCTGPQGLSRQNVNLFTKILPIDFRDRFVCD